ncbi:hypothetical protein [Micromonospora chokoriensis]|uniref:hypothetical protein n=1 Tax=Micromonospora chokoriensis TaxID=356851 RepID=UPI00068F23F7|nr:hypothetical protein [Micromonospora chokoriensis]
MTAENQGSPAFGLHHARAGIRLLLSRVRAAFAYRERPPAPDLTQRRRHPRPVVVPARGYVFTFEIHLVLTWYSEGLREDQLGAWSLQFADLARRDVEHQAANLARHFHPHQAGALEIQLNRELSRTRRRYERQGIVLHCRPEVRVKLDEEVKAELRHAHLQRLREESEHELRLRRIQLTDQLTQRWIALIDRLRQSPLAHAALRLSDRDLADILDEFVLKEERSNVEQLAFRLEEALRRSGRVGQPLEEHEATEIIKLLDDILREEETAPTPAASRMNGNGRHTAPPAGRS